MATTTDRRVVEIDVKTALGMQDSLKRAADGVNKLEKGFTSLKGVVAEFAGGLVAAFSVGAFLSSIKSSIDVMEKMGERSQMVGMTTEALSALTYQAEQTSISAEELDKGLIKMSKSLGMMGKESNSATRALESLGVVAGDTAETALKKIADQFEQMADGPQKIKLATEIFGKTGAIFIPMLNEGSKAMKEWGDEAERLGLIITEKAAAGAGEFNDRITALRKGFGGMITQLTIGLMPALLQIVNAFKGVSETGDSAISVGKDLGDVFKFLTAWAINTGAAIKGAGMILGAWAATVVAAMKRDLPAIKAIATELARDSAQLAADTNARLDLLNKPFVVTARPKRTGVVDEVETDEQRARRAKAEQDRLKAEKKAVEETNKAWVAYVDNLIAVEKAEALAANGGKSMTQVLEAQQARLDNLTGRAAAKQLAEDFAALDQGLQDFITTGGLFGITEEEYIKGLQRITNATGTATGEITNAWEEMGKSIQQSIEGWSGEAADTVLDFVTGVEKSFEGMVENVLRQFAKMALQKLVFDQLFSSFGGAVAGLMKPAAHGAAFGPGGQLAFASGGVVTGPTPFKFAGGTGIMGEAGPEAIMPLQRNSAGKLGVVGGGGDVTVNVINRAPGVDVGVERSGNGEREITVLIQQAVQDGFARGRFDGVMGATYGVNRRGR